MKNVNGSMENFDGTVNNASGTMYNAYKHHVQLRNLEHCWGNHES